MVVDSFRQISAFRSSAYLGGPVPVDEICLPQEMLKKIKMLFTEFKALESSSRNLAANIFGTVVGQGVCLPGFANITPIKELCSIPSEKAEILRECYRSCNIASDKRRKTTDTLVAHWLTRWTLEQTPEEAYALSSIFAWLINNDLFTSAICQLLSEHASFVKKNQFYQLELKDKTNLGLKQFILNVYLENLKSQKTLSHPNIAPSSIASFSLFASPDQQIEKSPVGDSQIVLGDRSEKKSLLNE